MRPYIKIIFALLLLLSPTLTWSQGSLLRRADNFYNRGEYFEALQHYQQLEADGYKLDIEHQIRVGRCHYERNNISEAWGILANLESHLSGYYLFVYAQANHQIEFYEGAIEWYRKARPENPRIQGRIDELIRSCEWAMDNLIYNPDVNILPAIIPTFGQSFGIQFYGDGVVYSSASPDRESQKKRDRTGRDMLDLYYSDMLDGVVSDQRTLFSENLVFPEHVGAISFTSDSQKMYYTRVMRVRGGSVWKIFSVEYKNGKWSNEQELPFNNNAYDNGHPAVSPDDQYLYFASNRPGGYGGLDLYVVERRANGTYGTPRNLGPKVNTFGNEVFPFISPDNILYFASDGHVGFGGLDLFKADKVNSDWGNVENMMMPFNSSRDDFGYVINPLDPSLGFLSTNRRGSGDEDEFFTVETRLIPEVDDTDVDIPIVGLEDEKEDIPVVGLPEMDSPKEIISPIADEKIFPSIFASNVISTFDGSVIEKASVTLFDSFTGSSVIRAFTNENGRFSITIPDIYNRKEQEFEIEIAKQSYKTRSYVVDISELEEIGNAGFSLTPVFAEPELDEISGLVVQYIGEEITTEGYRILDQIADYLLNNPNVVIRLNTHTDARGDRLNNLNTSQKVAEIAEAYLNKKGVSSDLLIPRGYGERYLLNNCGRGRICSEQDHLKNRRIEIVVWKIK